MRLSSEIVLICLLSMGCPIHTEALAYLTSADLDPSRVEAGVARLEWSANLSLPLTMVRGETEGVYFYFEPASDTDVVVGYDVAKEEETTLHLFEVQAVNFEDGSTSFDPLVPVKAGDTLHSAGRKLLYAQVTSNPSAVSGERIHQIQFSKESHASTLKFNVKVLPVTIPDEMPITIQASIWPYHRWPKNGMDLLAVKKDLLTLLKKYRINGAAGLVGRKQGLDTEEEVLNPQYRELVRFALDDLNFRRIRIPAQKMYNTKKPLSLDFPQSERSTNAFGQQLEAHLAPFADWIKNPKWAGRFGFKIWDEPKESNYEDVVFSYREAKKVMPGLKLELSEQPDLRLKNVADIWTTHIKYLKPEDVIEQHRLGKEVWLYANKVHGIDHPLFGMRILGWLLWKYDLDGYLFWAVNWWKEDPWKTVSSQKKDFLKRGTLVYPDPKTGEIYPSLRLEAFRDGIEDMLLLRELEKTAAAGNSPVAKEAEELIARLKKVYGISERYDNAPNPAKFRDEIIGVLMMRGVE